MKHKLNKRGSHVGMILSFVIFITFVIFLYTITEPATRQQKDKQFVLDYLKTELTKKVSSNLTSSSIRINEDYEPPLEDPNDLNSQYTCFQIDNLAEGNVIVKDEDNNPVNSIIDEDKLKIEWIVKRFFKIYYSEEEFVPYPHPENDCAELVKDTNYTIGLVKTNNYVFENKIPELANRDYDELKQELDIPANFEFKFEFKLEDGNLTGGKDGEPPETNVYAEESSIQYVDSEANIKFGSINIIVW